MPETFTWLPTASHSKSIEPEVLVAKFGDGYEQRVARGINNIKDRWTLTFTGNRLAIDPVDAFLTARGGVEAFTWKNPDEVTALYLCRKWTKSRERAAKVTISCEFERTFQ
jgi:phage-related protein